VCLAVAAHADAATWTVNAGGDLQAAINAAAPGDTILLAPGATYSGNFTLPAKTGTGWITIRTNLPDPVPAGTRITPATAANLAIIASSNTATALATQPYAHHYVLQLLQFRANASGYGEVLSLGDGSPAQNSLDMVPHDLIVDRVYIQGDPVYGQKRGIGLNSAATTIQNSYIAGMFATGQDSQAIAGWNGPGPFIITNNYLEAASENFLLGGADPAITNLIPSDITFTKNYVSKPIAWKAAAGLNVKNLFELKNAQRITIDSNIFEYNWVDAQSGYSILFTGRSQDGTAPWSVVQDVTFTNNIVQHVASGINILGQDYRFPSGISHHFVFRNNMFQDVSATTYGGDGRFMLINGGYDVTVDHNTIIEDGTSVIYADTNPVQQFVATNNIAPDNAWAIMGGGTAPGVGTIRTYFPNSTWLDGIWATANPQWYPTGNYYPSSLVAVGFVDLAGGNYRLAASSVYRGGATDGTDPGANLDQVVAATSWARNPVATRVQLDGPMGWVSGQVPGWGWAFRCGGAIQSYQVIIDGAPAAAPVVPASRPDVAAAFQASCPSLTANTGYTFTLDVSELSNGSHQLQIQALDDLGSATLSNAQTILVGLAPATVHLDTPAGTVSGVPAGWGWAFRCGGTIRSATVVVDGVATAAAVLGASRPDVAAAFRTTCMSLAANTGITFRLDTTHLSDGPHRVQLSVLDDLGTTTWSNAQSITVSQPRARVALDAPTGTIGGISQGWGWAFRCGGAIQSAFIVVDGVSVGSATLGAPRPDVAAAYQTSCPSISPTTGLTFSLDVSRLRDGAHTLQLQVSDDLGLTTASNVQSITVTNPRPTSTRVQLDAPFGSVSGHSPGWGWAFRCGGAIQSYQLLVDGAATGVVTGGASRPDVAAAYQAICPSVAADTGVTFTLDVTGLPDGPHQIQLRVIDDLGVITPSNVQTITVTNAYPAAAQVQLDARRDCERRGGGLGLGVPVWWRNPERRPARRRGGRRVRHAGCDADGRDDGISAIVSVSDRELRLYLRAGRHRARQRRSSAAGDGARRSGSHDGIERHLD
jgi:hypothetical protein